MRNTPLVGLCFAISLVCAVVASDNRAAAQNDTNDSGVVVVVGPETAGQAIVVRDTEGKLLDRIEPQDTITAWQYRLEPGNYELHLPGIPAPILTTVRPGEFHPVGIGQYISEDVYTALQAGQIPVMPAETVDPADNSLFFSLEPRPGTDDPGPMSPE